MLLLYLFATLLLSTNISLGQNISCGDNPNDIHFIGDYDDFNLVSNCPTYNGSIFINGGYNIDNLNNMESITTINGFLVIIDSHMLRNLGGLQNIESIYGESLYLNRDAISIKYNNNFMNDTYNGLCFTDLVNWTKITNFNVIDIHNGIDCPETCHDECLGCFGPGPRLCQDCMNYNSNGTCVSECYIYLNNTNKCYEELPSRKLELNINRINNNTLNISWDTLNISESSGVIKSYSLFRDGELIFYDEFIDNGYLEDLLDTYFIDTNLNVDREYTYQIEYSNSIGSILGNNFSYYLNDWVPMNISNLQIEDINKNNISIVWDCNNDTEYRYSIINNIERINIDYEYLNGICYANISDLMRNTVYTLYLEGYNPTQNIYGSRSNYVNFIFTTTVTTTPSTTMTTTKTSTVTTTPYTTMTTTPYTTTPITSTPYTTMTTTMTTTPYTINDTVNLIDEKEENIDEHKDLIRLLCIIMGSLLLIFLIILIIYYCKKSKKKINNRTRIHVKECNTNLRKCTDKIEPLHREHRTMILNTNNYQKVFSTETPLQRYNNNNRTIRNGIYNNSIDRTNLNNTYYNNSERHKPVVVYSTVSSLNSIDEEADHIYNRPLKRESNISNESNEYLDVVDSTNIRSEAQLNNPQQSLLDSIRNGSGRNNLKKANIKKAIKISGNENTIGRRHGSVIDELKTKMPQMVPKNMLR